jgi:hypothetical protein
MSTTAYLGLAQGFHDRTMYEGCITENVASLVPLCRQIQLNKESRA